MKQKQDLSLIDLHERYIPDLAQMVASRVKQQRKAVPVLSDQFDSPEAIVPILKELVLNGSGRVALQNGRPVGFMAGWLLPAFMGEQNGVVVPEAGFGTDSLEPARVIGIFRALYAELCRVWGEGGWVNQAIVAYREERAFLDFLFHQGFGGICLDAIRPAVPLDMVCPPDLRIREVDLSDEKVMTDWLELSNLHTTYMRASPICLGAAEPQHEMSELRAWLSEPRHHAWTAERVSDGLTISYLQMEGETTGTSMLVRENGNLAVTGAFTRPEARGSGVATLLLDTALKLAVREGMERVSVDFETRNTPAMSFWTRHFTPFTCSVLRCVDSRVFR